MTAVTVDPDVFVMDSRETLPLRLDATNLLAVGESPSAAASVLTDMGTETLYAAGLSGSPVVSGNTITQTVTALRRGHKYRLEVSFTAVAGKIWTMVLLIEVPY